MVEIEAVESDVDQEPAGCGPDQLFQMSPLAEVDHECLHLYVLGWWRHVGFDDRCVSIRGGMIVGVGIRVHLGLFGGIVHGRRRRGE